MLRSRSGAGQRGRAIVTLDLDFSDIRQYPPNEFAGLIVLRVGQQGKHHLIEVFTQVIALLKNEPLSQRLWIADEIGVRIRGDDV
jgi:hypothetical protein